MVSKVGIITFHYVHNFGAFLQAWALVKELEVLGFEPIIINYQPPKKKKFAKPSIGRMRFRKFMIANLPLSPRFHKKSQIESFLHNYQIDALICGSDQVWLTEHPRKYDPVYFLDFAIPEMKKIAYAPSVGYITSFAENKKTVKEALSQFDAISARDGNTEKALSELGFENIPIVMDPTLLVDFSELLVKREFSEDYIVVCGPITDKEDEYLKALSEFSGYKIIAIGTKSKSAHYQKKYVNQGEWLNYIAHSKLVVTTLFHGVMIAVNLGKPFVAIESGSRSFKLRDILSRLDLKDRLIDLDNFQLGEHILSALESPVNQTDEIISRGIVESEKYLMESIGRGD
jgi:hypothetical protein